MTDNTALAQVNTGDININTDGLGEAGKTLFERFFDFANHQLEPNRKLRMVKAEIKAEKEQLAWTEEREVLKRQAVARIMQEEQNLQQITLNAARKIDQNPNITPAEITLDPDFKAKFKDKAKTVTSKELQERWAQILAGEAATPGSFSLRSLNIMDNMDRYDLELFEQLCAFVWHIGTPHPIILNVEDEFYTSRNITYANCQHLDATGLIHFASPSIDLVKTVDVPKNQQKPEIRANYGNNAYDLIMQIRGPKSATQNMAMLKTGRVEFTRTGQELFSLSNVPKDPEIEAFTLQKWHELGHPHTPILSP